MYSGNIGISEDEKLMFSDAYFNGVRNSTAIERRIVNEEKC